MKHSLVFFGYAIASLGFAFIALLLYIAYCIPDCSKGQQVSAKDAEWLNQFTPRKKSGNRLTRFNGSFHEAQSEKEREEILRESKSSFAIADTSEQLHKIYLPAKPEKNPLHGNTPSNMVSD